MSLSFKLICTGKQNWWHHLNQGATNVEESNQLSYISIPKTTKWQGAAVLSTSSLNCSAEQWKIPWTTVISSRYKGLEQPWLGLQTQSWWWSPVQQLIKLLMRKRWRFLTTTLFHIILAAWASQYRHTQHNTCKWKAHSFQTHFAELNKLGLLVWNPTLSTSMKTKLFSF